MIKTLITCTIIISCFSIVCNLQASDSDDLNTNPQMNLVPHFDLSWSMAHFEANDLLFHIKVLKSLKAGSYEEAIKILDAELSKKGNNLKSKLDRFKAHNEYEKNLKKDIDSAIETYDEYEKVHLKELK